MMCVFMLTILHLKTKIRFLKETKVGVHKNREAFIIFCFVLGGIVSVLGGILSVLLSLIYFV